MIISNSTPRISLKNQRALITGASRGIGAEIAALFAGALEFFGTVDILVNNAGVLCIENLLETTVEHWEETQNLNLRAPLLLAQTVVPKMIEQRRGKVINISSIAGVLAPEGHAAYSASKAGLNLLTAMGQQVWGEPAKGDPMKARIPSRRFGEPIEVADLVLFLASSLSDFICGQVIRVDGGLSAV
jgi:NAD(P)-dependent dehydrogenase (short-subunit alcohol dehydrogenase family)